MKKTVLSCLKVPSSETNEELESDSSDDKDDEESLHFAALTGDTRLVTMIIQSGVDVNVKDERGSTPLHLAVSSREKEVIELLVEAGADLHATDDDNRTSLTIAAEEDDIEIVELLVRAGAEVNELSGDELQSPLHAASYGSSPEMAKVLIKCGAKVNLERGSDQQRPLHTASFAGNVDFVEELLHVKAEVNAQDKDKNTPLHLATVEGHDKVVHSLLAAGADLDLVDKSLKSPLHVAAWQGQFKLCHIFIEQGADLRQADVHGRTPLLSALHGVDMKLIGPTVQVILDAGHARGEDLDELVNHGNPSPLWWAVFLGLPQAVERLLARQGCKIDVKAPDGTDPLLLALAKGRDDCIDPFKHRLDPKDIVRQQLRLGIDPKIDAISEDLAKEAFESEDIEFVQNLPMAATLKQELAQKLTQYWSPTEYTTLMDMSRSFPYLSEFNEPPTEAVSKLVEKVNEAKEVTYAQNREQDLTKLALKEFCPILQVHEETNLVLIKHFGDLEHQTCLPACQQPSECANVRKMLQVCQLIQAGLEDSFFRSLEPHLVLVGSVIEATRIGSASEIDLQISFQALEDYPFVLDDSASSLRLAQGSPLASLFSIRDHEFDFGRLFKALLEEIAKILSSATAEELWNNLGLFKFEPYNPCEACDKEKKFDHDPHSLCRSCLPTVTHTKRGACLLLRTLDQVILSLDIVPVFPITGKTRVELFELVARTLMHQKPRGWVSHLKKFLAKDSMPPDLMKIDPNQQHQVFHEQIKLFNWVSIPAWGIMPAQVMSVSQDLATNVELQEAYRQLKALKVLLDVKVPSYTLKKVLNIIYEAYKKDQDNLLARNLVFFSLRHPELRRAFSHQIDFDLWQDCTQDIPLVEGH